MTTLGTDITRSLDDSTALSRYAATGDPRAFEVLVHRYQAMVLATCRRSLGHRPTAGADAEDATQEAFLRLAQHAGTITSNAAAWLHACAVRTSIDMMRKRGSQARAERTAGELARGESARSGPADGADRAAWHEIEPLLDEAIGRLTEADRELIVGRFLAGRSQKDMALEAGVNPGTMHRRIDKALTRLRGHLRSSGLTIAGGLGVTIAAGAAGTQVSPALTGSLVKTGLVGLASGGPPIGVLAGIGTKAAVVTAVGLLGIATVGVATMTGGFGGAGTAPVFTAGPGAPGTEVKRPKRATRPLPLSQNLYAGNPGGLMRFSGDTIVFEDTLDMSGQPIGEGDPGRVVFKIEDSERDGDFERLALRVASSTMPEGSPFTSMLGMTLEASFEVRGGMLTARAAPPEGAQGAEDMIWTGTRPPSWHPDAVSEADTESAPLAPGMGGVWFECETFSLVLDQDDITMKWRDYTVHRFRVLEWDGAGSHTRVRAICADSMNPRMVGERVRLLLRSDESGGYTLAMHGQNSGKLDRWPDGFVVAPDVVLMSFGGSEP